MDEEIPMLLPADLASLTPEEIDALIAQQELDALRRERNRRLAETDWWALGDRQMTPEQAAYRQALRDMTDTYVELSGAEWPVRPE